MKMQFHWKISRLNQTKVLSSTASSKESRLTASDSRVETMLMYTDLLFHMRKNIDIFRKDMHIYKS